jgi:hypothetical protein
MANLTDRMSRWLRSPQGQRMAAKAQAKAKELARDPKTRARVERLATRLRKR